MMLKWAQMHLNHINKVTINYIFRVTWKGSHISTSWAKTRAISHQRPKQWAIQRTWRATRLCCSDEQQQQAAGHVRIWCKRFCAGVWCEGLDLQPGKCRSCEIMMRKSHWSRERGWIKIGIMEDGWPTTLHGNIMRWIGHHLKPRCISKEVCNKDAVLSLAYFCTNTQVVFISQYFFHVRVLFFLKITYTIILRFLSCVRTTANW